MLRSNVLAIAVTIAAIAISSTVADFIVENFNDYIEPIVTDTPACLDFTRQGFLGRVFNGRLNGTGKCDKVGTTNIETMIKAFQSNKLIGGYMSPDPSMMGTGAMTAETQMDLFIYCGTVSGLSPDAFFIKIVNEPGLIWSLNQTLNADLAIELVYRCWHFTSVCTVYTNHEEWQNITGGAAPPVVEYMNRRLHQLADQLLAESPRTKRARLEKWLEGREGLDAERREAIIESFLKPTVLDPKRLASAAAFGTGEAKLYNLLWWKHPDGSKSFNEYTPFGFWSSVMYKQYSDNQEWKGCCLAPCNQNVGFEYVPPPPPTPAPFPAIRQQIMDRAQSWVTDQVPYCNCDDDCCGNCPYCGQYRCDCSGYVSYCLGLSYGYTTFTLPEVTHPITQGELLPGDIMLAECEHVALFGGWTDASEEYYTVFQESGCQTPSPVASATITNYPMDWEPNGCSFEPYRLNGLEAPDIVEGLRNRLLSMSPKELLSSAINSTLAHPYNGPPGKENKERTAKLLSHVRHLKEKFDL